MSSKHARADVSRVIGFGIIAIASLHAWSSRSRYLYEGDSLNFAFGMHDYAVNKHQPHPPGYPLFVFFARCFDQVFRDANTSLSALAWGFAVLSALIFFHLARRRVSDPAAVVLTSLYVASPGFLFHACTPTTYAVDLFASVAIAALAARAWQGNFRCALWSVVLTAFIAGIRQSGAVLMLPLVGVALLRACSEWRQFAYAALAGIATTAAWYVPTALLHGGVLKYHQLTAEGVEIFLRSTSMFFGAPASRHAEMALSNAIWFGLLALPCAALWLSGRVMVGFDRPGPLRSRVPRPFCDVGFMALWMVPNLLYVFLVHAPKHGYLCLTLPPLVLLLGGAAIDLLQGDRRESGPDARFPQRWLVAPVIAVLLSLGIWHLPRSRSPDALSIDVASANYRLSLQALRDADDAMEALVGLLRDSDAREELIIADDYRFAGLGPRKIAFYLPRHLVLWTFPDQPGFYAQRKFDDQPLHAVPDEVRRLWWVGATAYVPPVLGPSLISRLAYRGSWLSVWVTELGDRPLAVRVPRGHTWGDLRRQVPPRLGSGFFPFEGTGPDRITWASGPRSEVQIPQSVAGPVQVTLNAFAARSAQRMVVLANGEQLEAWDAAQSGTAGTLTFRGRAGWNQLELVFDSWNGVPEVFAPGDSRPLAVMIRQLSIETGDGWYELVSERLDPPTIPLLHAGSILDIAANDHPGLLGKGWANHTDNGLRWTVGNEAEVRFRLLDVQPLAIEVSAVTGENQDVVFSVNGRELTEWRVTPRLATYRAEVPDVHLARENHMVFRFAKPGSGAWMAVKAIRIAGSRS